MSKSKAIIYALLAAAFYAVNVPVSKLLLSQVGPTMMAALVIMAVGASVAAADTLIHSHEHEHQHTYTHFHNGHMHTHTIVHSHVHDHYTAGSRHGHHHSMEEFEKGHSSNC